MLPCIKNSDDDSKDGFDKDSDEDSGDDDEVQEANDQGNTKSPTSDKSISATSVGPKRKVVALLDESIHDEGGVFVDADDYTARKPTPLSIHQSLQFVPLTGPLCYERLFLRSHHKQQRSFSTFRPAGASIAMWIRRQ